MSTPIRPYLGAAARPAGAETDLGPDGQHRASRGAVGLLGLPGLTLALTLLVSACSLMSPKPDKPVTPPTAPDPGPSVMPIPMPPANAGPRAAVPPPGDEAVPAGARPRPSSATDPRAYRHDAARHLYAGNRERIYPGKLPPMLYAIGVLDVEVDGQGSVRGLHWQRAPRHAPEVIAEIERTVRAAAPYPAPSRMGRVVYTDVWLWDRSGRFQLDTLTEGQR